LGNKYIVKKLANRIIKDNSVNYIYPILDKILSKVKLHQPNLIRQGADYSMLKLKLAQEVKSETENKWVKRIISFGIKKMKLEDIDFQRGDLSVNEVVKVKIVDTLKYFSKPSRRGIWMVIGLQWVVLLVIWVLS
jgi:hypothetical protein